MRTGIQIKSEGDRYDLDIRVRKEAGQIISGLYLAEVTHQNQAVLLISQPGDFKEYPLVGVGINNMSNDHEFLYWKSQILQQLEADGQKVRELEITEDGLTLDAIYK